MEIASLSSQKTYFFVHHPKYGCCDHYGLSHLLKKILKITNYKLKNKCFLCKKKQMQSTCCMNMKIHEHEIQK
jgi:hypothetical protein